MNSIGFWDKHIMSAGAYEGEALVSTSADGENYKCLFVKENRLVGYILVGDVARAGIYTALIRERQELSAVDWQLLQSKPQLMALGLALSTAYLVDGSYNPFLYFRF